MNSPAFTMVMLPPHDPVTDRWPHRLEEALPGVTVLRPAAGDETSAALSEADAAYGTLPADLLARAPRLRWLQAPQAGPPPGFYYPALVQHPVSVTNMRDTYTDHVAAHTLALILAVARQLPRYIRDQAQGGWEPDWRPEAVIPLAESRALIVGSGAVGAETGRLLAAFGTDVVGVDARVTTAPRGFTRIHPPEHLDSLLPTADLVVLTVPHTPHTEGLMDAARLARMKPGSCLVNVGRGPTVRLNDLVAALDRGTPATAALDVFDTEPLPPGHALWRHPGALLTPHVAGAGPHADERRFNVLLENARRFSRGEPLTNLVDKHQWH